MRASNDTRIQPAYHRVQRVLATLAIAAVFAQVPATAAPDHWANGGVPMSDQRDMRKTVVRTITARLSKNALSIAVYGKDQKLLNELSRAARYAHAQGWPILGVVLGSINEPRGVDIYADGLRIAEQTSPGPHIYEQTIKVLGYGNNLLKNELRAARH